MIRLVSLTPQDSNLAGKYQPGETVVVECDATNEAITVTLPPYQMMERTGFWITKIDSSSNAVTVDANGNETVSGSATQSLSAQYDALLLVPGSDGWDNLGNTEVVGSHTIASHSDTTATGAELETLTDGSDAGALHIHDARYYTETELNNGQLDSRYYTEAEVDALLAARDALSELTDVTITGPASNDVLQWSGTAWVDRTLAEAGIEADGTAATLVGNHESTYNHANYDTAYGWGDHSAEGYVKADGTVALTGNWDAGPYEIRTGSFMSDAAAGVESYLSWGTALITIDGRRTGVAATGELRWDNGADGTIAQIFAYRGTSGNDAGDLRFYTKESGSALAEAMRINEYQRVAVGDSIGTPDVQFRVDGATDCGLQIMSGGTTNNSVLYFGDATAYTAGQWDYDHNTNQMIGKAQATEILHFDASGLSVVLGDLDLGDSQEVQFGDALDSSLTFDGSATVWELDKQNAGSLELQWRFDGTEVMALNENGLQLNTDRNLGVGKSPEVSYQIVNYQSTYARIYTESTGAEKHADFETRGEGGTYTYLRSYGSSGDGDVWFGLNDVDSSFLLATGGTAFGIGTTDNVDVVLGANNAERLRLVAAGGVSVTGNIALTGTVDGVDVAALKTDVDGFPDELKNLTTAEIQQLENIGATTISAAQWGYLGALDQALATTDSPTFGDLTLTGSLHTPDSEYAYFGDGDDAAIGYDGADLYINADINETGAGDLYLSGNSIVAMSDFDVQGDITVTGTVDGVNVAALKTDVDGFPDELKNLVTAEIQQLENIGATTISAAQWGYLGALDQALATTDSPTFAGLTLTGNITVSGTVDGVDVAALKTDVDGFPDELKNLTTAEIQQLENIGATTISAAQWGYLGALDQALATTDSPTFAGLTLAGDLAMGGNNITGVGTVDGVDVSAHAARHENGGADEIDVTGLSGLLADAQTPTAHTHDGDTLQLDGVNSDGGAFTFSTTGTVTTNQTWDFPQVFVNDGDSGGAPDADADDFVVENSGSGGFSVLVAAGSTARQYMGDATDPDYFEWNYSRTDAEVTFALGGNTFLRAIQDGSDYDGTYLVTEPLYISSTVADDAIKYARLRAQAFDVSAEGEGWTMLYGVSDRSVGIELYTLKIGGGDAAANCAGQIDFYTAVPTARTGTLRATISDSEMLMAVPIDMGTSQLLLADGAMGAPGMAFDSDPNTGLYVGTGLISLATNGDEHTYWTATQTVTLAGNAAAPSIVSQSDLDTGPYYKAADNYAISTGGTIAQEWDSSQNARFYGDVGIGTSPSYPLHIVDGNGTFYWNDDGTNVVLAVSNAGTGDADAGFYLNAADTGEAEIHFQIDGSSQWSIKHGDAWGNRLCFCPYNGYGSDMVFFESDGSENRNMIEVLGTGGIYGNPQDGTEYLPVIRFRDTVSDYGSTTATVGEFRGGVEWYSSESSGNMPAVSGAIYSINMNTYNTGMGLAFLVNSNEATPQHVATLTPDGGFNLAYRGSTVSNSLDYALYIDTYDSSGQARIYSGATDVELTLQGYESCNAILNLWADQGDDTADKFRIVAQHSGNICRFDYNDGGSNAFYYNATGDFYAPSIVGNAGSSAGDVVHLGSNQLGIDSSSRKFKGDIQPMDDAWSETIWQLQPVTYRARLQQKELVYHNPEDKSMGCAVKHSILEELAERREAGFIAEDAHELGLTEFVYYGDDGEVLSFNYRHYVSALHNELRKLREDVAELRRAA